MPLRHKKEPRGGELTTEGEDSNRTICSTGAIEYINQCIKQYTILRHTYRGSYDNVQKITKIACVVCALCNLNLDKYLVHSYRS